jgi:hypothetical protein
MSTPSDLDGVRHLMVLIISESETDAKGKNSEDDKMVGRQLDKDCCILIENASKIHQQRHEV